MYKGKFASELSMHEVKEYYDELRQKCPHTEEQWVDFNILKEKLIVFAYKILDGKTNGDVLNTLFPNIEYSGSRGDADVYLLDSNAFNTPKLITFKSWLNAPYMAEGEKDEDDV